MKVIALLSWYEEYPSWLAECVASISRLCDHVIAVDGPYAAFPGALRKPFSGAEQAEAIMRTAAGAGMGCTIHASRQPWWGNEVEKRDYMFQLGMTFAEPGDWFLRIDADEVLTHVPDGTRRMLDSSVWDVGEVMIWERIQGGDYQSPFRCLFRAVPGIRIEQAHFIVTAPSNGKRVVLNGPGQVPATELRDVRLEHRTRQRPLGRQTLKREYSAMINDLEKVIPSELGKEDNDRRGTRRQS